MLTVAGLGTRHASDDAIGLVLAEALAHEPIAGTEVVLWEDADALTLAQELLDRRNPVLVVDCADLGLPPGSCRTFTPRSARLGKSPDRLSVHGIGMAEAVELARRLGFAGELTFLGIQPFDLSPAPSLSPSMAAAVPTLTAELRRICRELSPGGGKT
jgi:hydrogenase maturation protease